MRSGGVSSGNGYLRYTGHQGHYWSTTLEGPTRAYHLYFNLATIYPTNMNYQYYGFSTRCLVSGASAFDLVRSGFVYIYYGYLTNAGLTGGCWTTTSLDERRAVYLTFYDLDVYAITLNNRNLGFSARCLASGG